MLKKNKKMLVVVMAAITVMAVGGVSAYFTSADYADNTWTVGKIKIDLQEPAYDENNEKESQNMIPNAEIHKDPFIKNTGINDAYVFLKFSIPKANVITADQDGKRQEAKLQELFDYNINEGWVKVAEDVSKADKNTYVYAYAKDNVCTALAKDAKTTVLFRNAYGNNIDNPDTAGMITFKNIIEGQGLEELVLHIPVEAYGIQTSDLGTENVVSPSDVWSILSNQTNNETIADLTDYVKL